GFRSGGQNYRGSTSVESFQPFLPEKVNEYEIGLKSEWFDRTLRLNLAAYYDDLTDIQRSIIVAVPSTGQTSTVQTNAASGKIKGVEAEGTWRVSRAFTLNGAIGVIDPKYDVFRDFTGDRSGEDWPTPKVQYSVSGTYVLETPVGDLTTSATWAGRSRQNLSPASKNKDQVTQKAYGLFDARIALDIRSQDVTIAIWGRNLTDKVYKVGAVNLESIGWNTVVMGEPRTYGIEITKRFGHP
ncbi:MAG: hypothetical protein JWQ97_1849, partial [Phenylobacterium sp.]|nr:hypothetical protein [Phenylobacterium sp.]